MGDTLTLEESFAKATEAKDSTLKEETTNEVETPVEETKEADEATPEDLETKSETELERIDPEKLPPELKSVYKDLMKGFTQGRQKDSERAKAAEERVAKMEKELAELRQGRPSEPQSPQSPQFKTVEEYYDYLATKKVEEKLREEKINSYREQALNDYEATDERLRRPKEGEDNPAYDEFMDVSVSGKLDERLAEHVAQNGSELGFDHKGETKKLIAQWEEWMQGRIKSYIDKQNQLVKGKVGSSKAINPKTSSGKAEPSKAMSFLEAAEAAQNKLKS